MNVDHKSNYRREEAMDNCEHVGQHSSPNRCIDCGRFSAHSYDTGPFYTQNGFQQRWGGVCSIHGDWEESAA